MTLRVARAYLWLAALVLLGSVAATVLAAPGFIAAVALSLLLLALVGLAVWGIRRKVAWGLVLWILTMILVAVPFLVAGIPHSGSITSTEEGGQVVTTHFEQPGSRGWLSAGLGHVLLAGVGGLELAARLRRRRRPGDRRLGDPLSLPAADGSPQAWVWAATAAGGLLLGWVDRISAGPTVPLGLLTVAAVVWGAVWPARWWAGGLLLGGGVLTGEVLRYLHLGLTGWAGRQGWATLAVLAPAVIGAYAGVAVAAAADRRRGRDPVQLGRRPTSSR
jgi:hypothetical protein